MSSLSEIIDLLSELCEDSNTTKNLKVKIMNIISILKADEGLSLKVNKASHAIDELASNSEIDSYTRTQLLGIVSALETVDSD